MQAPSSLMTVACVNLIHKTSQYADHLGRHGHCHSEDEENSNQQVAESLKYIHR